MNKALFSVFFFIVLLFIALLFNIYFEVDVVLAGIAELGVAISAMYTSAAVILEAVSGFQVLPYGKPLWTLKKLEL